MDVIPHKGTSVIRLALYAMLLKNGLDTAFTGAMLHLQTCHFLPDTADVLFLDDMEN